MRRFKRCLSVDLLICFFEIITTKPFLVLFSFMLKRSEFLSDLFVSILSISFFLRRFCLFSINYTASFLRPFCLLADKIFFPVAEAILTRNP